MEQPTNRNNPTLLFFYLLLPLGLQDLGHLEGPETGDFGGLDGAEDEPKRREAGALGTGRSGGGDGSNELRRGLS